MNRPDIEAIRERAEAASPGPWETIEKETIGYYIAGPAVSAQFGRERIGEAMSPADAEFIFHARQDIPALLSYVTDLERQVKIAKSEAFEEAAAEAEKPRTMFLSFKQVESGLLDDNHPIIKARLQMRKEIAEALREKATSLRSSKDAGREGGAS